MNQQQEIRLDLSQTVPILCECGNQFFQEVVMLRKWSRFASGLPTDQNVPIPVNTANKEQSNIISQLKIDLNNAQNRVKELAEQLNMIYARQQANERFNDNDRNY